jgi:signal transduction histidine kinase
MKESNHISVREVFTPPVMSLGQEFLQTVVDALPDSLVVIDRDYNIVLANKAARIQTGLTETNPSQCKCYQYMHNRMTPCLDSCDPGLGSSCPVRKVIDTKRAVREYHTHFGANGNAISVAVDAAPILDDTGDVVFVVKTCRDVTERSLSRRLLWIGNQHMEMRPLLDEFAKELRQFTNCNTVGFCLIKSPQTSPHHNIGEPECEGCDCEPESETCVFLQLIRGDLARQLPAATRQGSLRFDTFSVFMTSISKISRQDVGSCELAACESLALIPIRYHDQHLGTLYVADPRPHILSSAMVESLERLSLELATAIQRVRTEEALRTAHEDLENRVRARTAELTRANQTLQKEISERSRLEREILQVSVREQQRIGQELHDELGQELTGLSYLARGLVLKLQSQDSPHVAAADEVAQSIPKVLGQIQNIVRGLVPLEIGAEDLEIALDVLTSNVAKLTGTTCRFASQGCKSIRNDDTAIQIYRIAQEAITNAVKHSRAKTISVNLDVNGKDIRLVVRDDGIGIEADAATGVGCGLRGMRYRARAIGGRCEVANATGGGTVVTCVIPHEPPNHCEAEKATHDV